MITTGWGVYATCCGVMANTGLVRGFLKKRSMPSWTRSRGVGALLEFLKVDSLGIGLRAYAGQNMLPGLEGVEGVYFSFPWYLLLIYLTANTDFYYKALSFFSRTSLSEINVS